MTFDEKYKKIRELRTRQAKDQIAKMKSKYDKETNETIKKSELIKFENITFPKQENKANIIIEELGSVESIMKNADGLNKTAVLNFASYKNPGGGFTSGTHAQEECLCYKSNLYNVLISFLNSFYIPNRNDKNKGLYRSKGIYSPDVIFEKGDKTVKCDVITIASPNRGAHITGYNGTEEENKKALTERIGFVLETASRHKVETIILGAFGCGVFKQNSEVVAKIFKNFLDTNDYGFNKVIFAIPSNKDTNNLYNFKKVFSESSK